MLPNFKFKTKGLGKLWLISFLSDNIQEILQFKKEIGDLKSEMKDFAKNKNL